MKFSELPLSGAYVIELEPRLDHRGFFSRVFCRDEFDAHGLNSGIVQVNMSQNHHRATLRGMHYQRSPKAEVKVVRCTRGAIYDVIVDLRPDSPTYLKWHGEELTDEGGRMMYVPEGFAHGYQSLIDGSEVLYFVTEFYSPQHEAAVRWNDPVFGIEWPIAEPILSEKDAVHPDFKP